jgi:hypothetical protein
LFEPAGQRSDTALAAVLATVADSVELSLDVLQRYEVRRLPPADPAKDLARVKAYCQANHIDQAILGSGSAKSDGGYLFKLVVYDRRSDSITLAPEGSSTGALDMFEVTDKLVGTLLDGLSGTHLLFGSLSVESDPAGATVSVNGKEVGTAPVSLRGLPAGAVQLSATLAGHEDASTSVTITDGDSTDAPLSLARSTGTLALTVPKDAVVSVSSAEIGKKDFSGPGAATLPTGQYDVQASCPGIPAVSGKVTVGRNAATPYLPWPKGYLDVQAVPAGATIVVDGVERGVAPLVVDVQPGTRHHLELKHDKYETFAADVSVAVGDKTPLAPVLVGLPGAVRVETSIPGADVSLEGQWGRTPFVFENVATGRHLVRVLDLKVGNRMYTAGQPTTVEVNPGETTVVSKELAAGTGHLTIVDAPPGSVVQIDGKEVDSNKALTTGIDVPAGSMNVTVQGPTSQRWNNDALFVGAGGDLRQSVHALSVVLPRRTIQLNGKTDSWAGIEPIVDLSGSSPTFMGDAATAIARVFMCRDDKNLYWRVDFAERNPLLKPPKRMKWAIGCELEIPLGSGKQLNLGASYNSESASRVNSYAGIVQSAPHQWSDFGFSQDFKNSDAMLVERIGLDRISKYLKEPVRVRFNEGDQPAKDKGWDEYQGTELVTVDLSK